MVIPHPQCRRRLILKSSSECSIDQEVFYFSVYSKPRISDSAARIVKSRARNNIIASVLNILLTKKQALALQCALSHHRLFKQASACGYFWKDNKRIHATLEILNNQNEMLNLVKVKVYSINRGRISDDKNKFVTSNIVSIVTATLVHSTGNYMKHINVPKTLKRNY